MPDGKSFKIHADGSLEEEDGKAIVEILKSTFNQTRFKSFLRQLQLYGFERTYKGPHRGECKHELFVRGRRDLLHKKSIEDFQQKANDNSNRSPKSVLTMFQLSPTPAEVTSFMKTYDSSISISNLSACPMPSCPTLSSSTDDRRCQYLQTSGIPTRLINLVLSDIDSADDNNNGGYENDSDDCELSTVIDCPLLDKDIQVVDINYDLMSINRGENIPHWTGMELDILRDAL